MDIITLRRLLKNYFKSLNVSKEEEDVMLYDILDKGNITVIYDERKGMPANNIAGVILYDPTTPTKQVLFSNFNGETKDYSNAGYDGQYTAVLNQLNQKEPELFSKNGISFVNGEELIAKSKNLLSQTAETKIPENLKSLYDDSENAGSTVLPNLARYQYYKDASEGNFVGNPNANIYGRINPIFGENLINTYDAFNGHTSIDSYGSGEEGEAAMMDYVANNYQEGYHPDPNANILRTPMKINPVGSSILNNDLHKVQKIADVPESAKSLVKSPVSSGNSLSNAIMNSNMPNALKRSLMTAIESTVVTPKAPIISNESKAPVISDEAKAALTTPETPVTPTTPTDKTGTPTTPTTPKTTQTTPQQTPTTPVVPTTPTTPTTPTEPVVQADGDQLTYGVLGSTPDGKSGTTITINSPTTNNSETGSFQTEYDPNAQSQYRAWDLSRGRLDNVVRSPNLNPQIDPRYRTTNYGNYVVPTNAEVQNTYAPHYYWGLRFGRNRGRGPSDAYLDNTSRSPNRKLIPENSMFRTLMRRAGEGINGLNKGANRLLMTDQEFRDAYGEDRKRPKRVNPLLGMTPDQIREYGQQYEVRKRDVKEAMKEHNKEMRDQIDLLRRTDPGRVEKYLRIFNVRDVKNLNKEQLRQVEEGIRAEYHREAGNQDVNHLNTMGFIDREQTAHLGSGDNELALSRRERKQREREAKRSGRAYNNPTNRGWNTHGDPVDAMNYEKGAYEEGATRREKAKDATFQTRSNMYGYDGSKSNAYMGGKYQEKPETIRTPRPDEYEAAQIELARQQAIEDQKPTTESVLNGYDKLKKLPKRGTGGNSGDPEGDPSTEPKDTQFNFKLKPIDTNVYIPKLNPLFGTRGYIHPDNLQSKGLLQSEINPKSFTFGVPKLNFESEWLTKDLRFSPEMYAAAERNLGDPYSPYRINHYHNRVLHQGNQLTPIYHTSKALFDKVTKEPLMYNKQDEAVLNGLRNLKRSPNYAALNSAQAAGNTAIRNNSRNTAQMLSNIQGLTANNAIQKAQLADAVDKENTAYQQEYLKHLNVVGTNRQAIDQGTYARNLQHLAEREKYKEAAVKGLAQAHQTKGEIMRSELNELNNLTGMNAKTPEYYAVMTPNGVKIIHRKLIGQTGYLDPKQFNAEMQAKGLNAEGEPTKETEGKKRNGGGVRRRNSLYN